jgi:hypothetical protein
MAMSAARTKGDFLRPIAVVAVGALWGCGSSGAGQADGAGSTPGEDAAESADAGDAAVSSLFDATMNGDAGGGDDASGGAIGDAPVAESGDANGDASADTGATTGRDGGEAGSAEASTGGDAGRADGGTADAGTRGDASVEGADGGTDGGTADAGHADGSVVDSGTTHGHCKRGIAANAAPSAAFAPTASSPGITWWYNWSNQGSSGTTGIEYVPMIWGSASLNAAIPAGSHYLLGFNEPNFKSQADLTSQQAATDWPTLETTANGIPLVSPGVNYCGSSTDSSQCTDPAVTDPYTYLKDFFGDCSGCEVDYVAAHWYNCDLPSLQAYLEGNLDAGGGLQGFVQFKKPIWLTEFSCDGSHSVADQKAYMQAAIPYLENNPNVFRYSWFSATPIPNAELMNSDGSLTDLGTTYVGLPESCSGP